MDQTAFAEEEVFDKRSVNKVAVDNFLVSNSASGFIIRTTVISFAIAAAFFGINEYITRFDKTDRPPEPDAPPDAPTQEPTETPEEPDDEGEEEEDDEGTPYDDLTDSWSFTDSMVMVLGTLVLLPIIYMAIQFNSAIITGGSAVVRFVLGNLPVLLFLIMFIAALFLYYLYRSRPTQRSLQFRIYSQLVLAVLVGLFVSMIPGADRNTYVGIGFWYGLLGLYLLYADVKSVATERVIRWLIPGTLLLMMLTLLRFRVIGFSAISLSASLGPVFAAFFVSFFGIQIAIEQGQSSQECEAKSFAVVSQTVQFKAMVNANTLKQLKTEFRRLNKELRIHPDYCKKDCKNECSNTFSEVQNIKEERENQLKK